MALGEATFPIKKAIFDDFDCFWGFFEGFCFFLAFAWILGGGNPNIPKRERKIKIQKILGFGI